MANVIALFWETTHTNRDRRRVALLFSQKKGSYTDLLDKYFEKYCSRIETHSVFIVAEYDRFPTFGRGKSTAVKFAEQMIIPVNNVLAVRSGLTKGRKIANESIK